MYCIKCGKELEEAEVYCSFCGTKAGQVENQPTTMAGTSPRLQMSVYQMGQIENCKPAFLLAIVLPIICTFLMKDVAWNISFDLLIYSDTIELGMFENNRLMRMLFYVGYIAVAGLLAMPIFTDGKWSTKNLIAGKVIPVAALAVTIIGRISLKNQLFSAGYDDILRAVDLQIELSSTAWYFIAANITMFAAVSYVSTKTWENQYYADKAASAAARENGKQNAEDAGPSAVAEYVVYDDESWQCICGRKNMHYIFTCACGANKRDLAEERVKSKLTEVP